MQKLSILVVDDEEDIRKELVDRLKESPDLEIVGQSGAVEETVNLIQDLKPDAVFMDIKLLGGDAFDVLQALHRHKIDIPPIILNTGYREFELAQRAFNDFKDVIVRVLKKPFWKNWKEKENDLIEAILAFHASSTPRKDASINRVLVRSDNVSYILPVKEVLFLQVPSDQKGKGKCLVKSLGQEYVVSKSLNELLCEMPSSILRISRFSAVNQDYISRYDHSDNLLYLDGLTKGFVVGRAFQEKLLFELGRIG